MGLKSEELYQQSDCPLERATPEPVVTIENGGSQLLDKKNGKNIKDEKPMKPMSSQQMNMRGVFLHVLADALGSVIVCISASIILWTDFPYKDFVDPSLSVLMVCLIMYSTYPLLVESAMILLQTVPTHIQVDSLQKKLLQEVRSFLLFSFESFLNRLTEPMLLLTEQCLDRRCVSRARVSCLATGR